MVRKSILKGIILSLTACCFTSAAEALCLSSGTVEGVGPGFYMGLMAGPSTNNGGQQNVQIFPLPTAINPIATFAPADPKSTQFGSRFFLGYKFNWIAGFELGFVYFSGVNYVLKNSTFRPAGGTTFRVRGIDLVGKLDYSIFNVGVFGKAGVVALYTTTPGGLNITNFHTITTLNRAKNTVSTRTVNSGSNTYGNKLAPTFSVGISYNLNQSWVTDLSMTTYMVGGAVSSMTMFALGLSYHFVDRFCGQFLCDD